MAGDRVTHLPGATSPTIGYPALAGSASQTDEQTGGENTYEAVSSTLVSGTHFLVTSSTGANDYATTFAQISSTTTTTDQAAAVTDRTGWLSS